MKTLENSEAMRSRFLGESTLDKLRKLLKSSKPYQSSRSSNLLWTWGHHWFINHSTTCLSCRVSARRQHGFLCAWCRWSCSSYGHGPPTAPSKYLISLPSTRVGWSNMLQGIEFHFSSGSQEASWKTWKCIEVNALWDKSWPVKDKSFSGGSHWINSSPFLHLTECSKTRLSLDSSCSCGPLQ